MKKSMKKLVVGTLAGAFSLMAVGATNTDAATIIAKCDGGNIPCVHIDGVARNQSTSFRTPKVFNVYDEEYEDLFSYWQVGWNNLFQTQYFDLTSLANSKTKVTGTQTWYFRGYNTNSLDGTAQLRSIQLCDELNNTIAYKTNLGGITSGSKVFSVTTNLQYYDLDYDGSVTLSDAQFATKVSVGTEKASGLQVILGDNNGDGTLDKSDAQYILKVALGII